MRLTSHGLSRWLRSPARRKKLRYLIASAASVIVGQAVLAVAYGGLRWSAFSANLLAFAVAAAASYHLNRAWVWCRGGRSDMLREVVPFWGVAALGLLASSVSVSVVEQHTAGVAMTRDARTAWVMAGSFASVGAVWVFKYLLLNRFVFPADQRA